MIFLVHNKINSTKIATNTPSSVQNLHTTNMTYTTETESFYYHLLMHLHSIADEKSKQEKKNNTDKLMNERFH